MWFAVVFVFFSLSQSKLPPYLFPAIPAAAVLAARGLPPDGSRRLWIAHALLATALAAAVFVVPQLRAEAGRRELVGIVAPLLAVLVLASWAAVLFAGRSAAVALTAAASGWAAFFAAVAFSWPQTPQARLTVELAAVAREAAAPRRATIVGYRNYLSGVSWQLKTPIVAGHHLGELEPEFETRPEVLEAFFWKPEKFWPIWERGEPLVVIVRMIDLVDMMKANPPARVIKWYGKYAVVANFPAD